MNEQAIKAPKVYKIGDAVSHWKFGQGVVTVEAVEGSNVFGADFNPNGDLLCLWMQSLPNGDIVLVGVRPPAS